jgi:hypothetical protein
MERSNISYKDTGGGEQAGGRENNGTGGESNRRAEEKTKGWEASRTGSDQSQTTFVFNVH